MKKQNHISSLEGLRTHEKLNDQMKAHVKQNKNYNENRESN